MRHDVKTGLAFGLVGATFALAACSGGSSGGSSTTPTPEPSATTARDAAAPAPKDASTPTPTPTSIPDAGPIPDPDDGGTPAAFPAPAHGALLGAFVGVGMESESDTDSEALFTGAEALIGRRWVIDNRFYDDKGDWANARTKWDIAQHKIPLVSWMPYGNGDPLGEIIAGQHDAEITAQAMSAKALGSQVLLRWAHEMNGNWYPWAGASNGGANGGPAKYIAAWRHVHDLFVKAGATNVIWVWCPLVADVPAESWNHWTAYYPGDDYVDWVGLDAYNWGSSSSCCVWQSFGELVDAAYQDYAGKKPIMLPETASAEVGGDKGAWIADMRHMLETRYTDIHAVVWFDINKETDWRINSSPPTLTSYAQMAQDPYFAP